MDFQVLQFDFDFFLTPAGLIAIAFLLLYGAPVVYGVGRLLYTRGKVFAILFSNDRRIRGFWKKPGPTIQMALPKQDPGLYKLRNDAFWWRKGILFSHRAQAWQEGISEPLRWTNPEGLQPAELSPATLYDLMEAKTIRDLFRSGFDPIWIVLIIVSMIALVAVFIGLAGFGTPPPEVPTP